MSDEGKMENEKWKFKAVPKGSLWGKMKICLPDQNPGIGHGEEPILVKKEQTELNLDIINWIFPW